MKKLLLIIGLTSLFAANSALANYTPLYLRITTVNNFFMGEHTSVGAHADGDFEDKGGSGGAYEFDSGIMSKSDDAKGTLHIGLYWSQKKSDGTYCLADTTLNLPLSVQNQKIVIPAREYVVDEGIKFNDEKCRANGIKSFDVNVIDSGNRYIIKAIGLH